MDAPLKPGFYPWVEVNRYHADNLGDRASLSSSIAKLIVDRTPKRAWLAHPRLNQTFVEEADEKFDFGSAIHDALSSAGKRVQVLVFDDWRTKAAKDKRAEARAMGFLPLLEKDWRKVEAVCAIVVARINRSSIELGQQEAIFLAEDRGVLLRAMLDSWNPPWVSDFKITSINLASDFTVGSHIADMDYDLRAWFYLRVASLVFPDWAGRLKYRWLFVEKDEPHGMRVVEADATQLEMGRRKGEHAIGVWQRCMASGKWPHLEGLPATVPYPGYKENAWLERETKPDHVMGPMEALRQMSDRK